MGRWLDEALADGQGLVRHPHDGPSANRPSVIVKFVLVAFILALVLPPVFIVGAIAVGYSWSSGAALEAGLALAFLLAVMLAVVLVVRRALRAESRR